MEDREGRTENFWKKIFRMDLSAERTLSEEVDSELIET
jgi:hypothetical protein